ncbi:short-chain dehydrogenase [Leucogyrophana mollusca]|uniref:Short-chain dehydrogenase n=1 Tax=Leucogyrophana mollusca TaxID=85980 RepID=A0ACB8B605_9AGAM|nr:short-chain dehydrogenase [Leucogyrophana mollusca]
MSKPVVVITGASKGIGLAVTRSLLEEHNAIVVALSRTRTPELDALFAANSHTLLVVECDVTDEEALTQAISLAEKEYHRIDGLILNAATLDPLGRIDNADNGLDGWKRHFDVNFFSLLTALKAALPALRKSNPGKVIFISSGAATGHIPGWAAYNASKAAMNSLSRTLAKEEPGIVSLALAPGKVDTDMQGKLRESGAPHMTDKDHQIFVDAYEQGTLVKPYDVGYVIAGLSLGAPLSLSGQFVRWDEEECKDFRRR